MRIIFLNVWGGTREAELLEYIKNQTAKTDIFCLQEASEKMKTLCKDALADYEEVSNFKYVADDDQFAQSIYVKRGLELISHGTLLDEDKEAGLANYVQLKADNKDIYVFNVHGIAHPGDKLDTPGRLRQSEEIINFLKYKDVQIVVGGDFNILPEATSITAFSVHGYRNLVREFAIDTTRNRLAWEKYPNNKQYYSDYVFINDSVELAHFEVPKNEVSDHLPLIVDIK